MTIAEHIAALRDLSARGEIEWEKIPTVTFDAGGNVGNMRLLIDVCGEARPAVVVERARFERLRRAVEIMDRELTEKHGWETWALFHPGDLDPLPD